MSIISDFFIKCSGANRKIIAQIPSDYLETEETKFTGIGGAIFFTACLAFISSTFALSTFVEDISIGDFLIDKLVLCILFGLVWAVMIFNLDRYIVSSMRKRGNWMVELLHASPRILVALLFAAVISKPLELEIFNKEIETQLPISANEQTYFLEVNIDSLAAKIEELKAENDTLLKNPYQIDFVQSAQSNLEKANSDLDSLSESVKSSIASLEGRIRNSWDTDKKEKRKRWLLRSSIDSLQGIIDENATDIRTPSRELRLIRLQKAKDRIDKNIKDERKIRSRLNKDLTAYREQISEKKALVAVEAAELDGQKQDREFKVRQRIAQNEKKIESLGLELEDTKAKKKQLTELYTGLLARLKALDDLKSAEGNWIIYLASTLVFLIFIAVETAPIFVKLISNQTLYDQILEEYEQPLENKEHIRSKINGFYESDAVKQEKEKATLLEFYEKKLNLQKEYLEKSLAFIREKEAQKFEKSKDDYVANISENPKSYLSSFKSDSSPLTKKGSSLVWEEDGLATENIFKRLWPKIAMPLLIVGIFSIALIGGTYLVKAGKNYFATKALTLPPEPKDAQPKEMPIEKKTPVPLPEEPNAQLAEAEAEFLMEDAQPPTENIPAEKPVAKKTTAPKPKKSPNVNRTTPVTQQQQQQSSPSRVPEQTQEPNLTTGGNTSPENLNTSPLPESSTINEVPKETITDGNPQEEVQSQIVIDTTTATTSTIDASSSTPDLEETVEKSGEELVEENPSTSTPEITTSPDSELEGKEAISEIETPSPDENTPVEVAGEVPQEPIVEGGETRNKTGKEKRQERREERKKEKEKKL